jgi:hypothetical protein
MYPFDSGKTHNNRSITGSKLQSIMANACKGFKCSTVEGGNSKGHKTSSRHHYFIAIN